MNSKRTDRRLATYQIRVRGDPGRLTQWLDGLTIVQQANGEALLTGTVVNQDALHRVLRRIRDMRVSVRYLRVTETCVGGTGENPKGLRGA